MPRYSRRLIRPGARSLAPAHNAATERAEELLEGAEAILEDLEDAEDDVRDELLGEGGPGPVLQAQAERLRALRAAELALDLHYRSFRTALPAVPVLDTDCKDIPDAPLLPLTDVFSDGGAYDEEFGPHNLFEESSPLCYCSLRRSSINVTAQLQGPGSFTLVSIELRTPSLGYTSPLGQAILFTSFGRPDVAATKRFDEVFSEHEYREQLAEMEKQAPERPSSPGLEVPTPAAFVCTVSDRVTARLDVPRAGRWILLKLLRPREPGGDNIDVQFVGCRGWRGAHSTGVRDVY